MVDDILNRTDEEKKKLSEENGGMKFSKGKNQLGLVLGGFSEAIWELGIVGTKGALKYAADSWKTVPDAINKYNDALDRHILMWRLGEDYDPEFGTHHLAHAAWNCLAILSLLYIQGLTKSFRLREKDNVLPEDWKLIKKEGELKC